VNRKLVVYVPQDSLEPVRDALFAAGAGRIGDYERCSWYAESTSTYVDPQGADAGIEQRNREIRLETVYPEESEAQVIQALRSAHPYEEPSLDLYDLREPA